MFFMNPIFLNQKNNSTRGFTLIELILVLGLSSILIVVFYTILSFTVKVGKVSEEKDEIIQNGRYAIDYIIREIRTSDKIIALDKFENLNSKYPNNLGFVIQKEIGKDYYKYIIYYCDFNKIRRCAVEMEGEEYPKTYLFQGHNVIAEYICNIDNSIIDLNRKMITLDFQLGTDKEQIINLRTSVYLRCPVEY